MIYILKISKFPVLLGLLLICACGGQPNDPVNPDPNCTRNGRFYRCNIRQHTVTLTWQESDSTVVGFNVYRGAVSGGPYAQINTALVAPLNYVDDTVESNLTYYYVVTSVNKSGAESIQSSQVSAFVPID